MFTTRLSTLALALGLFGNGLVAANPLLVGRATCNADNCARQVTGTSTLPGNPPRATRQADCQSFLATTVTPAPVVSTSTVTITSGQQTPVQSPIITTAQTKSPSSVPTYVNSCGTGSTLSSRYSSACACFSGVTRTVTTANTPTSTTTVYATTTPVTGTCTNGQLGTNAGATYTAYCDQAYAGPGTFQGIVQATSQQDCASQCDVDGACFEATYVYNTASPLFGQCTFYYDEYPAQPQFSPSPGSVAIILYT